MFIIIIIFSGVYGVTSDNSSPNAGGKPLIQSVFIFAAAASLQV